MYDIEAIETINFEQLVTVTDRLLLRGRASKRRPSTSQLVYRLDPLESRVARSVCSDEHTVIVSRRRRVDVSRFAAFATLFTAALAFAIVSYV